MLANTVRVACAGFLLSLSALMAQPDMAPVRPGDEVIVRTASGGRIQGEVSAETSPGWLIINLPDGSKELIRVSAISQINVAPRPPTVDSTGHSKAPEITRFYTEANVLAQKMMREVREIYARAGAWPTSEKFKKLTPEQIENMRSQWLEGVENRDFVTLVRRPYVILVEKDSNWCVDTVATSLVVKPLQGLVTSFLKEYAEPHALEEPRGPLGVVLLRDKSSYQQYRIGWEGNPRPIVLCHFEPDRGRLVLNGDVKLTDKLHTGVHLLLQLYTRNALATEKQSFWFQEGLADWFSGTVRTRVLEERGEWQLEPGLLKIGRIRSVSRLFGRKTRDQPGSPLSLDKLLRCTNATAAEEPWLLHQVHAQAGLLVHFCNFFKVDDEEYVQIGSREKPVKGFYKEGWDRYVGMELNGVTGKQAFMKAMQIDEAGLAIMSNEFEKYQKWVLRKIMLRHVKAGRLIPATEWRNSRGKSSGLREDDRLASPGKRK